MSFMTPIRLVRSLKFAAAASVLIVLSSLVIPIDARAQSPFPNAWMEDAAPGGSYDAGVGTVIVEGLGSMNCAYNWGQVLSSTIAYINAHVVVVTEFSPQTNCDTLQDYQALMSSFTQLVEQNAPAYPSYWLGFMLDEEPGWGLTPSDLETLNQWTSNIMNNTQGIPSLFTENEPNGWDTATYNAIIADGYVAPQVYSASMAQAVNQSYVGNNSNMVTTWTGAGGGYGNASTAINAVNGPPFGYFGYLWYNKYRNA